MHFLCNCLIISMGNFHFFLTFFGKTRDFMFFSSFSPLYTYARNIIIRNARARVYIKEIRSTFRRKCSLCAQDETRTHTILRPLPPQSSVYTNFTTCAWVPRTGLEPAHLAACAPETHASTNSAIWAKKKSGKRDSNSRPRPWQGRALPTELFPQFFLNNKLKIAAFSQKRVQKYCFFLIYANFLAKKCKKSAFSWILAVKKA